MERRERNLRVHRRASSANSRLGMARRATVGVEGRAQSYSAFYGARHGIDLLEYSLSSAEHGLLLGAQRRERAASASRASARTRIALCQTYPHKDKEKKYLPS